MTATALVYPHIRENEKINYCSFQIIQQGRDHGLPGYSRWRQFCNLPSVSRFEDLRDVMAPATVEVLKNTYARVEDLDLFTGGLAEVAFFI